MTLVCFGSWLRWVDYFSHLPRKKESHRIGSHHGFTSVQLKGERHQVPNSGGQGKPGMPSLEMLTLGDADSKTDVSRKQSKMRKRRQIRAGGSRCGALPEEMVAQPGRWARHSEKEGALGGQGTWRLCAQHQPLLLPFPLLSFHGSSDDSISTRNSATAFPWVSQTLPIHNKG